LRRGSRTATDTGNGGPGRGNDTFPAGQRHVGRGQRQVVLDVLLIPLNVRVINDYD
jgi:hypothetical protein